MSSGNWSVYLDQYNQASKTWSGANGIKTENPYSMTHNYWAGSKAASYVNGVFQMYVYANAPSPTTFINFSNEESKAYAKLADAVRGSSFDGGVFLGEMGQTLDLIVGRAESVLTAYRNMRRGRWEDAVRALARGRPTKGPKSLSPKDLADFWLELKYGWEPLLGDIYEGCKAVKNLRERQASVLRVQQSTRDTPVCDNFGHKATRVTTVKLKAKFFDTLSYLGKLSLTDPRTVAWELCPWSFVVDWFIPVGDFLSASSVLNSLDYTVVTTRWQSYEFHSSNGTIGPFAAQYRGGGYSVNRQALTRAVGKPVIPLPSFKTLEKALSLGHIENAAALVTSQIRLSRSA